MNIDLITNESKIDFDQWNKFVENHPYGNFFQSPYAYNFFNTVPKHISYVVFTKVDEKIIGVLSG